MLQYLHDDLMWRIYKRALPFSQIFYFNISQTPYRIFLEQLNCSGNLAGRQMKNKKIRIGAGFLNTYSFLQLFLV